MSEAKPNIVTATFQVLEGIDRGVHYPRLELPITIGREEGNPLRLNDERVSRFHAKIQAEGGEIILTDLESTNGTRVNGHIVAIRRLRAGDRIQLGRTVLLFGSPEEIAERVRLLANVGRIDVEIGPTTGVNGHGPHGTVGLSTVIHSEMARLHNYDSPDDLTAHSPIQERMGHIFHGVKPLPPLPENLRASDIARMAELFDFLHRQISHALETSSDLQGGDGVKVPFGGWQRLQKIQMALAMYLRAVTRRDG